MLISLSIKNLALIEDCLLELKDGLNILVGESGAGKSLIMTAVKLLTGIKSDKDIIRHGEDFAIVEAVFDLNKLNLSRETYEELGLVSKDSSNINNESASQIDDEEQIIILSREIRRNSRSLARINGRIVPLSLLQNVSRQILDIHSQHDILRLFDESNHINILDDFASTSVDIIKENLSFKLNELRAIYKRSRELILDPKKREMIYNKLAKQVAIFDELKLSENEETTLINRREKLLRDCEELQTLYAASELINGGEQPEFGIYNSMDKLGRAFSNLYSQDELEVNADINQNDELDLTTGTSSMPINRFDTEIGLVENIYASLNDLDMCINRRISNCNFDDDELRYVEQRLKAISRLKQKLNLEYEDLIEYEKKIRNKLQQLDDTLPEIAKISDRKRELEQEVFELRDQLRSVRKAAAETFCERLVLELKDLGMPNVEMKCDFSEKSLDSNGADKLVFLFSANFGEKMKSLSKVASGGEATRLLLSIKLLLAHKKTCSLLLFDEIEQGVSGELTAKMAAKLAELAKTYQILCISHQAQMVAYADHLYKVEKYLENDRTISKVHELRPDEVKVELAALIGKNNKSKQALDLAEELLRSAEKEKFFE